MTTLAPYGHLPYTLLRNERMGYLMMATESTEAHGKGRVARLEARVTGAQKALLQRAATLSGRTLSDFVVASAEEAAAKVIQAHETIRLTREEQIAFVTALLNPHPVGSRLHRAAAKYRRRMGS